MAISVNQNGHFEEMEAWLQILQIGSWEYYTTLPIRLLFDTHESPGSVFIWKPKFTIKVGIVEKN